MAGPRNKAADYLAYLALRLAAMFVHMFSLPAVYGFARAVGNLWYRLDKRHRRRAIDHLRASFPEWSSRQLDQAARASFRNLVYLAFEALLTTRRITYWRWNRYVILAEDKQVIRNLVERNTGIICLSGHLGGWEVAGYTLAALGFAGYAVARPLDNPYLNSYLMDSREKMGLKILDKRGAMEAMGDIFRHRDYVSFIADQDAGRTGVFVDFFGRKASTYKAPALMAMRYGVPLAVGYGRRIGEQYRFQLGFERVIYPHQWASEDNPLEWITQQYTSALEDVIRRCPEQYLWIYRRWKTRPKGEKAGRNAVA